MTCKSVLQTWDSKLFLVAGIELKERTLSNLNVLDSLSLVQTFNALACQATCSPIKVPMKW